MAARSEVELHFKPVIDAPTVRPGDRLLVRIPVGATREHVQRMADELKERLPGVEVCVIAAEQLVVYRPDSAVDGG